MTARKARNMWDVPNVVEDDRGRGHNRQVEETPERSAKMRPDSLHCKPLVQRIHVNLVFLHVLNVNSVYM